MRTLGEAGLVERARVVMEKPFGTDLSSARELNDTLHEVFAEDQIFRIDHFLGKEAALNMLALRFANGFLEPLWNHEHIDHVQIDVPETLDVHGRERSRDQHRLSRAAQEGRRLTRAVGMVRRRCAHRSGFWPSSSRVCERRAGRLGP